MSVSNPCTKFTVELTQPGDAAPIRTSLRPFLQFSSELSRDLDELENRWEHLSAHGVARGSACREGTV
jgi:hypothetical protein